MTKKRKAKVRRSKAAEGTRGGVVRHAAITGEAREGLIDNVTWRNAQAGIKPGPRAPSPLDELLSDLHLRAPVAREPWLHGIEKALSKFVGELNECERFETMNSEVRSPLCN